MNGPIGRPSFIFFFLVTNSVTDTIEHTKNEIISVYTTARTPQRNPRALKILTSPYPIPPRVIFDIKSKNNKQHTAAIALFINPRSNVSSFIITSGIILISLPAIKTKEHKLGILNNSKSVIATTFKTPSARIILHIFKISSCRFPEIKPQISETNSESTKMVMYILPLLIFSIERTSSSLFFARNAGKYHFIEQNTIAVIIAPQIRLITIAKMLTILSHLCKSVNYLKFNSSKDPGVSSYKKHRIRGKHTEPRFDIRDR